MSCACIIGGTYDLSLQNVDCKALIYEDLSQWTKGGTYVVPESYTVQVTVPGNSTPVDITVYTNRQTIITAETLGLSGDCVPDGIYCFVAVTCDTTQTKTKANTCNLKCGLQNAIQKAKTDEDWDVIDGLSMDIRASELYAERKMEQAANEAYYKALKTLNNINCNCPC